MSSQRILVTGADGCVGRTIVSGLRTAGHAVHGQVFGRAAGRDESRLDLSRADACAGLPEGFDTVVHCAGNVNPAVPTARMFAVNTGGTRHLLRWAQTTGVRHFVQISSVSVYGGAAIGLNRVEAQTPRRRWLGLAYARSKAAAELAVENGAVPYTILRLPMVIGAGDVFATPIIASTLCAGRFFLAGDGQRPVSLITVPNIGPLLAAVVASGPAGCALNLADHHVPWQALTRAYAQELGVAYSPGRPRWLQGLAQGGLSSWGFLYGYSRFGGEFPTGKLQSHIGPQRLLPWRQAVTEAVRHWRKPPGGPGRAPSV